MCINFRCINFLKQESNAVKKKGSNVGRGLIAVRDRSRVSFLDVGHHTVAEGAGARFSTKMRG